MKISSMNRAAVDPGQAPRRPPARSVENAGSRVAVSREAKKLAEARAPAVSDAAKIARITAAIARGDFMVDANKIVENMVREEG